MSKTILLAIGLVLAILGGLGLVLGGVPYQDSDTLFEIGDVEAQVQTERELQIPPLAGAVLLATGVGVMVVGAMKKS